jgi:hypothetical protein
LLLFFLWPTFVHGSSFGVGPDEPVYLWWARVGASQGISLVGSRPGTPALISAVAGTLHLSLVPALAGLQYAMGIAIGPAAVALVHGRARGGRAGWLAVGLLAGMFGVHLAGGYVANLAFALAFVAAAAALARRSRRGVLAAILLLGGGGLSHPQFFLVGAGILLIAALAAWILEPEHGWRSDAGRVVEALVGGGAIVGAGLLWSQVGPASLSVDTSKDGFLRRVGLREALHQSYVFRLQENVRRYAPWVTLPLAAVGVLQVRGFTRRFLLAWLACTIVGVPIGIATGWFPPERVMTFGFALPILAGLGLTWIWERTEPRRIATVAVTAVLLVLVAVPTINAQREQQPFMSPEDLAAGAEAGRIAATLPPGTPLVFVVDDLDTSATFLASHVANIARATVPPERADDVYVFVGRVPDYFAGRPTVKGTTEYDTLSRTSLEDLPDGPRALFVVREYDRDPAAFEDPHLVEWTSSVWSDVEDPRTLAPLPGELGGSGPWPIGLSTIAILVVLCVIGSGWARWAFEDPLAAAATATAFGVAALTVTALILERLGVPLTGSWGPTIASALACLLGYGIRSLQGKAMDDPSPEVDQGPDHEAQHERGHDPVTEP